MAYYLHHLPDGTELPKLGKARFLILNVPGSFMLPGPPMDYFQNYKVSSLVAVKCMPTHDAACWVDIQRQLEICSMPEEDYAVLWMIVPDAGKMIKK